MRTLFFGIAAFGLLTLPCLAGPSVSTGDGDLRAKSNCAPNQENLARPFKDPDEDDLQSPESKYEYDPRTQQIREKGAIASECLPQI